MSGKLLILDLDETLIHATEELLAHPPDVTFGRCHVYLRPHLAEFVEGVLSMYKVAIWTAGGELYARQIIDHIFPEGALQFLWTSGRCTLVRDWESGGYKIRKRLKKVKKKGYPLESVIVVEDKPGNFAQSYGNVLEVREFSGNPADDELRLLLEYLRLLKDVPNVRAVEKRNWREQVGAASTVFNAKKT